jgi:hypothetical protein
MRVMLRETRAASITIGMTPPEDRQKKDDTARPRTQ